MRKTKRTAAETSDLFSEEETSEATKSSSKRPVRKQKAPAFIFKTKPTKIPELRQRLFDAYHMDEAEAVAPLIETANLEAEAQEAIQQRASKLVQHVRDQASNKSALDLFMQQYDLSSEEGVLLMCLAEALLRIPDAETQDKLIKDKIGSAQWEKHIGHSDSTFVNAGTWALMLTGRVLSLRDTRNMLNRLVARSGEPVIRQAMMQAMRILGKQFVMGRTIKEALKRSEDKENRAHRYSFDMLGEGARTREAAERYFADYKEAIRTLSRHAKSSKVAENPGVSVKLSALHPRYEYAHKDTCFAELRDKLFLLCERAMEANINLCVDAEEADRLDISLDLIEDVYLDSALKGWQGFGLAVQAYQKRAFYLIDWLADLVTRNTKTNKTKRPIMLRLVKGAYWDSEVKWAQEEGYADYPVFTRKAGTDVSYLACAQKIFGYGSDVFYPQMATHNAHTIAYIENLATAKGRTGGFEFQRLHGMGEDLYDAVTDVPCRVYAPVGQHEDLLPYLVRRLLENGANTSFVNRVNQTDAAVEELTADPVAALSSADPKRHPRIPLPDQIYLPDRGNSAGLDLTHTPDLLATAAAMQEAAGASYEAGLFPTTKGNKNSGDRFPVTCPTDHTITVGHVTHATDLQAGKAVAAAHAAFREWDRTPATQRAEILEKTADLLEENRERFYTLACLEAGKTLPDGVAEVREAADFLRYYAVQARTRFTEPMELPGPTGEINQLSLAGRGVFVCVSPWNFPLAIFAGQIAAALAAGNTVVAKPADQTPLIGYEMVKLFYDAGLPDNVLHFVPGKGRQIGNLLVSDPLISGVAFTGSTGTAQAINRQLAHRDGPIAVLIAETGGQNAAIVDSSALLEQTTDDVVRSAFLSAGQRCSALRVLYVQEDIAEDLIAMIKGAMAVLKVGDPALLATDVGPVIDSASAQDLLAHIEAIERGDLGPDARVLYKAPMDEASLPANGSYVAPHLVEIQSISQLDHEHFGPILHVVRYKESELNQIIEDINDTGYGLTLGIHSRIGYAAYDIASRATVGNIYVNRNQIGAIVCSQPFGGEGLSGTGPKAGGPNYLTRFGVERTLTIDTTAAGGNASLMMLD